MPNKTIYVADADAELYDHAQAMAGGNLSAAITQALRQFVGDDASPGSGVGTVGAGATNMEAILIKVGKGGAYAQQRFYGRLLGKQHVIAPGQGGAETLTTCRVYQTERGRFALYISVGPNWSGDWRTWANWGSARDSSRADDRRARQGERRRQRRAEGPPWDWTRFARYADEWEDAPLPPTPSTPPDARSGGAQSDTANVASAASATSAAPEAPEASAAASGASRDGAWWESSRRLEVYDTLDDLRAHIPPELAAVVAQALSGAEIEDLDI